MDQRTIDERTLEMLDFPAVREKLAACCASSLGKALARELTPSISPRQVAISLAETDEARALLDSVAAPPLYGLHDIADTCRRALRGGRCEPADLLQAAEVAAACRRLRAHLAQHPETARLQDYAVRLPELPAFQAAITKALTDDGEVRDDASSKLGALRRKQRTLQSRVRERLESMVRSPALAPYLQDPIVTMRHDRFVVPVRADARAHVPGVVHDASGSGATVFVEPMAVLELNNDLRRAQAEEEDEVERILADLSAHLGRVADRLLPALQVLGHLDLVCGRAALGVQMDARSPELADTPLADLVQARHPLLERPVPIDIRLGADFDVLVVTGPNTGGKTVALKTVGLFVAMAQAGLQLPAGNGTRFGVFRQVFCDLGDEQGVVQNLSTFSSHMTRIVAILRSLRPGALVLLDELGAGTDPAEGAALATALLEALLQGGARCIATTHQSELKAFAYRQERAENASVTFDADTLQPTFHLVIGLPGGSHALQIAARLGLPAAVGERARTLLGAERQQVESLLAGMAADERRLREARVAAESASAEAEALRGSLAEEARAARERARRELDGARAEAAEVLREAKREADEVVRALRRAQSGSRADLPDAETARARLRQRLDAVNPLAPHPAAPVPPPAGGWRPGMRVYVRSLRQTGSLLAVPGAGGTAPVQVGVMRVNAGAGDLEPAEEPDAPVATSPARDPGVAAALSMATELPGELDLRGLTADEAIERLDRYLDDMALAGRAEARIIHGKGTGALRQAVGDYLRGHRLVAGFRLGESGEGGAGVTVLTLRG